MYKIRTAVEKSDNAQKIAAALVNAKLACSVHIAEISSVYGWGTEINMGKEYELSILTRRCDETIESIKKLREHKSPEILIEDVAATPETVDWCVAWCDGK